MWGRKKGFQVLILSLLLCSQSSWVAGHNEETDGLQLQSNSVDSQEINERAGVNSIVDEHGRPCIPADGAKQEEECLYGLKCNDKTKRCGCASSSTYWTGEVCAAFVDEPCNELPSDGSSVIPCTLNARCYVDDPDKKPPTSKCYCYGQFSKDLYNKCVPGFKGPCSPASHCKESSSLECIDSVCACGTDSVWGEATEECLSLLGETCGDSSSGFPFKKSCAVPEPLAKCTNKKCECSGDRISTIDKTRCVITYDKTCTATPTDDCNPDKFLTCEGEEGKKVCGCGVGLEYDTDAGLCRVNAEGDCSKNNNCAANSECNEGICECNEKFVAKGGKCWGQNGANCTASSPCDGDHHYECGESQICGCKEGYTYNEEKKKCVGYLESPCADDTECDAITSTCSGTPEKKCTCKAGYVPEPSSTNPKKRVCFAGHNTSCTAEVLCNKAGFLSCEPNTKRCQCETPLTQLYDSTRTTCVSKASESCGILPPPDSRNLLCLANADCTAKACKCKAGFIPNKDKGACALDFGKTCKVTSDCADKFVCRGPEGPVVPTTTAEPPTQPTTPEATASTSTEASEVFDYEEINALTCSCLTTETYNPTKGICEVNPGKSCGVNPVCGLHATCNTTSLLCACDPNYTVVGTSCLGVIGANCTVTDNDCNGNDFLACSTTAKVCECKVDYRTDSNKKCIGYVNSSCRNDADCDPVSSKCDTTKKTCQCNDGYRVPDGTKEKRQCLGTHGSRCSTVTGCDPWGFLTCRESNLCGCVYGDDDQVYDEETFKCTSYPDTSCDKIEPYGAVPCITNSTCTPDADNKSLCKCDAGFHTEEKYCKENSAPALESFWVLLMSALAASLYKFNYY